MGKPVTGVSAVNAEGVVIVFCEDRFPHFDYFTISGQDISLVSEDAGERLTRAYGTATAEAVRAGGTLVVQPVSDDGRPAAAYRIGVAHGRG